MNPVRRGLDDMPTPDPPLTTREVLMTLMDELLRKLLPGRSDEVRRLAYRLLMRRAMVGELRRELEQSSDKRGWRVELFLMAARKLVKEIERDLLREGVTPETLEDLKGLYPLADDIRLDERATAELQERHGCSKCRHCYASWERARGDREGDDPRQPFCQVYGGVPAFCLDFQPTRSCSGCGRRLSPKRLAESSRSIPVECAACEDRDPEI